VAQEVHKVRPSGITLVPEAGTQRLRNVIKKGTSEEEILDSAANAFRLTDSIKLYFMIGLPLETEEDLQGIVDLCYKILKVGKEILKGRHPRINISLSTFVPKPHTPFQWEKMISLDEIRTKQGYLKEQLRNRSIDLRWHQAEESILEGVFSRGDRALGKVIEEARRLGCRLDAWSEHFKFDLWQKAFENCGVDYKEYLKEKDLNRELPWEHIDTGVSRDYLLKEREKALKEEGYPVIRVSETGGSGSPDIRPPQAD
jgi:radical SAM superfamily enzyme YgiQ (UPF0313 family)